MASEREDNKALADRLRGKAMSEALAAGKQLAQQVGKLQTVTAKDLSGPTATPNMAQEQSSASVRERHITEKSQQGRAVAAGPAEQKPSLAVPEQSQGAAKDKNLAEIAQSMRQAGVTNGRAANDVARPQQTPAVAQKPSRGRGR